MDSATPDEDEALKQFLGTTSFGRRTSDSNGPTDFDQWKRNERKSSQIDDLQSYTDHRPGDMSFKTKEDDGDSDREDEEDDDSDDNDDSDTEGTDHEFPVSHELVVKTHNRAVTTISLDNSGNRMITGSIDCTLKLHDFSSMTPTTIRAFKSVDPAASKNSTSSETHPVHQVLFNPLSASRVLVITAYPQAKIFDRDGELDKTFVKGDMYLRDMHNTKGHISEVTCGAWNPSNRDLCVTAGTDSTLRIWDVNNPRQQKEVIVIKSKAAGSAGRTRITAVAWATLASGEGNLLIAATYDGSLVMWTGNGPYSRPSAEIKLAHEADTWTSAIDISTDGRLAVTRGGDNTIKLWDTRRFKKPLVTMPHTSNSSQYPTSNISFSPDSSHIITGSIDGSLHILSAATLRPELTTPITPGSPTICVLWHAKLNQIITGSANGEIHVLYDLNLSNGGAKAVMLKAPKRRHIDDDPNLTTDMSQGLSADGAGSAAAMSNRQLQTGLTASGKSRDPRRPHLPAVTPFAKSQPGEEHVRNNIPLSSMRDEDPREALLKYAEKATKEKLFTNAWAQTQPKTVYAELSDDDDGPDQKKVKR